jgi:sulfate transport system permease protein
VLPGFGLSLGVTLAMASFFVIVPLALLVVRAASDGWGAFVADAFSDRALASYRLSVAASFGAATVNVVAGFLLAWVLTRYTFAGRAVMDALIDLPFALPTAVAGIVLTSLLHENGAFGKPLAMLGIKVAFTPLGIMVALIFIGLPFVVRMVQPVLLEVEYELEEAAASLGATRWQTFRLVVFPRVLPSLLTGYALAFARSLGEYGSVVFIAGNMPMKTEIPPLLIISKLEQYDYAGAASIAVVMLTASFGLLLAINGLQLWSRRFRGEED